MKTKKYFLAVIWGILIMMPNFAYSQFEGIDSKIEEAKRKAAERAKELKNPDTQRSRGNERERTYIPPMPEEKYEYDGVTYSTRKEMEAAKARAEAAKKKAKEENWRNNIKPGIDAGFRPINSANNSSSCPFAGMAFAAAFLP